jgi:hypothetical protein
MPETQFSLRSFPGSRAPEPDTLAEAETAPVIGQAAGATYEAGTASTDQRAPIVESLRRSGGNGSGAWEAHPSLASWPSLPAPPGQTRSRDSLWHPLAPSAPAPAEPAIWSQPSTELVPPPLPEANRQEEASASLEEASTPSAARPQARAPSALPPKPGRPNPWTVVAGIPVLLLVGYLVLLPLGFYGYRVIQARQTDSVTLVANLGHSGDSQITVLFTTDDWLQVTEIDNDDPTRVTQLSVTQVIALADSKVVVEAWLQAILVPGRLDLVMQLESGQAFQPAFTTMLVNNVAAVKKDPHAPGLRAPTASELQQARHNLGIRG